MLIELDRHAIQPVLYDEQNFQKEKKLLFDNEQLLRSLQTEERLKEFREAPIGSLTRLHAHLQIQRGYGRVRVLSPKKAAFLH